MSIMHKLAPSQQGHTSESGRHTVPSTAVPPTETALEPDSCWHFLRHKMTPILWWWLGARALVGAIGALAYVHAVLLLPLGNAITVFSVYPVITVFSAWCILGERVSWHHFVSLVLVIGGVVCIAQPHFLFGGGESMRERVPLCV